MTQDQPGQAQGTGYVVRGEVVPDQETEVTQDEESGPMTRFKRVASALRGDRPDQTAADPADATSGPGSDEEYAQATRPDDVGAVRGPDTGNGGHWDGEQDPDATIPDETPASGIDSDPSMIGRDTYGTTMPAATGTAWAPDHSDEVGTEAASGSPAGTEAGYRSRTGDTPGFGNQAGTTLGSVREAGTATGYGSRADTATGPRGLTGTGAAATEAATAESASAGRHAAAEDAGLRPGEATDRLGDFGDIAFGNLLPDAGQYSARWQQIQFRFVDDPQASVTEAADVISQVTAKLETAIQERQRAIQERQQAIQERASALRGRWGEGTNADTETLRETLRMYRAFMDQLIGPTR